MKKTFRPALIGIAAGLALAVVSRDLHPVSLITIGDGIDPTVGGGGDDKTGVAGIEVREGGDPAAGENQQQQQEAGSSGDAQVGDPAAAGGDPEVATDKPADQRQQE